MLWHWPTITISLLITTLVKPKGLENLRILYSQQQNLSQKGGRYEAARDTQGGKADKTTADTRTPTSYALAVKTSNQKLTITSLTKQNYSNVAATVAMGPNEAYAMCRWTLAVADPLAPLLINNNNNMLAII